VRLTLDSNCLVAAVLPWHEHHQATRASLRGFARRRAEVVLAAHSLVEASAVLTRLPGNQKLSSLDALAVLEANWGGCETVALTAEEHWSFLRHSAQAGIAGGLLYDALLAACARKARVDLLLSWNDAHLGRFAGPFQVRRPAG
jgi:predicted nucleic acid-binding protein